MIDPSTRALDEPDARRAPPRSAPPDPLTGAVQPRVDAVERPSGRTFGARATWSRPRRDAPIAGPIALPGEPSPPPRNSSDMKPPAQGSMQRANRKRIAVALCAAGLVAGTLSSNLVGAGATDPAPVPGETVATPSTQVASTPET